MSHPIQTAGLDHIVLRIVDKEKMVAFYRDVLGCPVEWDRPDLGMTHMRVGASLIDLVTVDGKLGRQGGPAPGPDGRNLDHFALVVRPFDEAAIRAHLAAYGVEVGETAPRFGADGEGPSIYIKDPEGNTVELKGPPD
ncbi:MULTISPECIES: VOC family protein [unclassified Phenylobacterium]|uniref:VOC family protein n=1 Tax=unclassified Phenylobacterium TaxID=2640670 RepID=UPI0022B2ED9E|nr:VOC family protein [Phenylobacterium sp. NIBR 498073]WGU38573.1 VOC family protein [Phenylobacterium sp. NIBR 498073]